MFSLINEGFNRKYLSEEYFDNIKVDVKNVLAQYGYDVNADGEINAVDALWALQSAVGKRVVEWPLDKAFPE